MNFIIAGGLNKKGQPRLMLFFLMIDFDYNKAKKQIE